MPKGANSTSRRRNEIRRNAMKAFHILLATAFMTSGGAAAAQSASDAQCIIVSNAFASGSKDANQQKTAEATLYFYLGRVASQTTAAQLKAILDQQAKTLTDDNAGAAMNKCVQAIQSKIQLLQSLAKPSQGAKPAQPARPAQPQGR